MSEPRTVGGSLLRAALDEAERQAKADPARKQVTAYVAYDKQTGAEVGAVLHWKTDAGNEWALTGKLARKVTSAQSPYAVRLELKGTL